LDLVSLDLEGSWREAAEGLGGGLYKYKLNAVDPQLERRLVSTLEPIVECS
jgi:hypothetical protein